MKTKKIKTFTPLLSTKEKQKFDFLNDFLPNEVKKFFSFLQMDEKQNQYILDKKRRQKEEFSLYKIVQIILWAEKKLEIPKKDQVAIAIKLTKYAIKKIDKFFKEEKNKKLKTLSILVTGKDKGKDYYKAIKDAKLTTVEASKKNDELETIIRDLKIAKELLTKVSNTQFVSKTQENDIIQIKQLEERRIHAENIHTQVKRTIVMSEISKGKTNLRKVNIEDPKLRERLGITPSKQLKDNVIMKNRRS